MQGVGRNVSTQHIQSQASTIVLHLVYVRVLQPVKGYCSLELNRNVDIRMIYSRLAMDTLTTPTGEDQRT